MYYLYFFHNFLVDEGEQASNVAGNNAGIDFKCDVLPASLMHISICGSSPVNSEHDMYWEENAVENSQVLETIWQGHLPAPCEERSIHLD